MILIDGDRDRVWIFTQKYASPCLLEYPWMYDTYRIIYEDNSELHQLFLQQHIKYSTHTTQQQQYIIATTAVTVNSRSSS